MTMPIAFVDTETTALGHLARPWEIATIRREPDGTEVECLRHVEYLPRSLPDGTNPEALQIGGWWGRGRNVNWLADTFDDTAVDWGRGPECAIARHVHKLLDGAVLVGVGIHFDAAVLAAMFRRHGLAEEPWHYAIVDLKAATWGFLRARAQDIALSPALEADGQLPMRSEALAAAMCVTPPADDERHTALGDARWARRWFDRLAGGAS